MNVLFIKTIQSHIKRNAYMDRCVKYSNLREWITLFQSRNRIVPHIILEGKQSRTQGENQLINDL